MTTPEYALGSDDAEVARLQTQAAIIAEPTGMLLQRGGVQPGMRVLDLGSGPGDVAFQVADMVGVEGSVVGLESDPVQIAVANRRRDELGLTNVEFREGDARSFVAERPFDAVVCRLLLMHLPDAVDVLAHHLSNLRVGGVFVAVDYDTSAVRSLPEVELWTRVADWAKAGFTQAQIDHSVGARLRPYFQQAGYSDVGAVGLQSYWLPTDDTTVAYAVATVSAMKDAIVASGVTTEAEMDLDTLGGRLTDALTASDAVWTLPTVVGGWGRRP